MNKKESYEGFMGEFGGRKGEGGNDVIYIITSTNKIIKNKNPKLIYFYYFKLRIRVYMYMCLCMYVPEEGTGSSGGVSYRRLLSA